MTRFLAPEVMGELGVAVILVFTASQLSNIGFGQYVVAKPKASRAIVFHASLFNIVAAIVGLLLVMLLAEPLAPGLGAPDMAQYVPGMALAVFFQRLSLIPERVVVRDMRFRTFALGTSLPELIYTVISLSLAANGWGGMSIVIANVFQLAFRCVFFMAAVHWRDWIEPHKLTAAHTREIFRFGVPISIGNLAGFLSRRWDGIIMTRLFGLSVMGAYNLAFNLAKVPGDYVGSAVSDVLMPSFANMEPPRARLALVRAIRLLSIIVFPLAVGLGAVADTLVATLFNEEWQGIAPFLMVLSFPAIAGPVGNAIQVYLKARDMPRAAMVVNITAAGALLGLVYLFGQVGPLWAALGVGTAAWLWTAASLWMVHRYDQVPWWSAVSGIIGPMVACVVMTGGVFGVRFLLGDVGLSMSLLLASEIATGAVVYIAAAFVFAGPTARELIRVFRTALSRRGSSG